MTAITLAAQCSYAEEVEYPGGTAYEYCLRKPNHEGPHVTLRQWKEILKEIDPNIEAGPEVRL